jgi:hypothetical protein
MAIASGGGRKEVDPVRKIETRRYRKELTSLLASLLGNGEDTVHQMMDR